MTFQVDTLRRSHQQLKAVADALLDAARDLDRASIAEREERLSRVLGLLREDTLPHFDCDERVLFPELAVKFADPLAIAAMELDHAAIREWIDRLAASSLDGSAQLERLLYGLHALITVHVWKEERLFIPALETSPWPSRV